MVSIDSNIDIDSVVYLCPFGSNCRYGNSCSGIGGHSLDICKKEHIASVSLPSLSSLSSLSPSYKSICPLGDKCTRSIPAHKFIKGLYHCNRGPYTGYVVCFSRRIIKRLKKDLKYITYPNNKSHNSTLLLSIQPREIENCISEAFASITIDSNQSDKPLDYTVLIRQIKQAQTQAKKQINDWTLLHDNIEMFINTISSNDANFKKQMDQSN